MKRIRFRIVLIALALVAGVVLIAAHDTMLPSLPFRQIPLDGPTFIDSDGQVTAVVDKSSKRVLILDADDELIGYIDCTAFSIPIDTVVDVCVSGGCVYLAGMATVPNDNTVEMERVVVFNRNGMCQGTVFEMDESRDGDWRQCFIASLCDAENGAVAAVQTATDDLFTYRGSNIALVSFENGEFAGMEDKTYEGQMQLYDAGLSPRNGYYAFLSIRGLIESNVVSGDGLADGHTLIAVDISDDGTVYACDDTTGNLCRLTRNGSVVDVVEGNGFSCMHVNNETISACDTARNTVVFCDLDGGQRRVFDSVALSPFYSVQLTTVWLSGAYLVAFVVMLAVSKVRGIVSSGRIEGVGPMFASVAVVLAVAVAVGSSSYQSYQSMLDTRAREVKTCADGLLYAAFNVSEEMERLDNREVLKSDGEALEKALGDEAAVELVPLPLVKAAEDNGIDIYYAIYGKDDRGVFFLVDSNSDRVMGTSAAYSANEEELKRAFAGEDDEEIHEGRTLYDTTRYCFVTIPTSDYEGVAGVIEIGYKVQSYQASIADTLERRILALLVMMLVVYLAYSELRGCGRCLVSYRWLQEHRSNDAVAALTRPFTFAVTMLTSIDGVLTVLIARDLLEAAGVVNAGSLLALPAVMLGIGLILGQMLYGRLGFSVGLRRLMGRGAMAMLCAALFTAAAVASGLFWLYCVAKLVMAIPFGMLYSLGFSLPRIADSDRARSAAAAGVKRTDTSAAALGTVIGGYAAQALGNTWVYVLIAIACIPVLLIATNLLPKGAVPLETHGYPAGDRKGALRFLGSRQALALALLVILPATLASGYALLLFPVFSADLGLSKISINNIVALGQLAVYVLISQLEAIEGRFGVWHVSIASIALLGAVFLLFSVNTTLIWSVVVIVLVAVFWKPTNGWRAMWLHAADENHVPAGQATGAMFAARSLTLIVQPFVLGALLGVANRVAVVMLGAICVGCALAFYLATRNTTLSHMN